MTRDPTVSSCHVNHYVHPDYHETFFWHGLVQAHTFGQQLDGGDMREGYSVFGRGGTLTLLSGKHHSQG